MYRVYVNWAYHGQESEPHILVIHESDVEAALSKAEKMKQLLDNTAVKLMFRLDYPVRVGFASLEILGEYMDDFIYEKLMALESGEYANITTDEISHWRKSVHYEEDLILFAVDQFGVYAVYGDNPYEHFQIDSKRSKRHG